MKTRITILLVLLVCASLLAACGGDSQPAAKPTDPPSTTGVNRDLAGMWRNDGAKEKVHIFFPPDGIKMEYWSFDGGEQFILSDLQYDGTTVTVTVERPSKGTKTVSKFTGDGITLTEMLADGSTVKYTKE